MSTTPVDRATHTAGIPTTTRAMRSVTFVHAHHRDCWAVAGPPMSSDVILVTPLRPGRPCCTGRPPLPVSRNAPTNRRRVPRSVPRRACRPPSKLIDSSRAPRRWDRVAKPCRRASSTRASSVRHVATAPNVTRPVPLHTVWIRVPPLPGSHCKMTVAHWRDSGSVDVATNQNYTPK